MSSETPVAQAAPGLTGIVPRWEWRTFGQTLGPVEAELTALPAERVQESDEVYLLSLVGDASVKVRDELIDVKELEHVSPAGLEQWRPVMKSSFPLGPADVAALLHSLGVAAPTLDRASYTLAELLELIVEPNDLLQAVDVHKHREHYRPNGCMAELTEVRAGGRSTRTLAIEGEDPALVIATVQKLGLASLHNTRVALGLKQLVGFGDGDRYAAIDVGTNSVKLHVAEQNADGAWRAIIDRSEITRLGEGLKNDGPLQPKPVERTAEAIAEMVAEARSAGVVSIAAAGTAAMRTASNSQVLIDLVRERCGLEIDVIGGKEEARLSYLAATSALEVGAGSLVVFETGGGSSQFTFGRGRRVEEQFSVKVGAVGLTERFGLDGRASAEVLGEAMAAAAHELSVLDGRPTPGTLVALGGAVTNLAAVKHELAVYDPLVVQGTVLDRAEIDRQIDLFRARTANERRRIVGLQPKRAEVILAGACIVRTVLEKLRRNSLTVSDQGLRHGLIADRFGNTPW